MLGLVPQRPQRSRQQPRSTCEQLQVVAAGLAEANDAKHVACVLNRLAFYIGHVIGACPSHSLKILRGQCSAQLHYRTTGFGLRPAPSPKLSPRSALRNPSRARCPPSHPSPGSLPPSTRKWQGSSHRAPMFVGFWVLGVGC